MGVLGSVLFAFVWIASLVENFATQREAVSLEIYHNELIHNPLFWWPAFVSGAVFGIVSHIALRRRRQRHENNRIVGVLRRDSASFG